MSAARVRAWAPLLIAALAAAARGEGAGATTVTGGRIRTPEGLAARTIVLRDGLVAAVEAPGAPAAAEERRRDVRGAVLLPGFVDSHVHLMLLSEPGALLAGGLAAVVDMGAPPSIGEIAGRLAPLSVTFAGQVLTAPGGYPTRSLWGREGYGREVQGAAAARAAVREAHGRGARVVKMACAPGQGGMLSKAERVAIVAEAHALGMPVGAHALTIEGFAAALDAGVDLLVHAPVERIDDASLRRFCGRPRAAVIPTLRAFGASAAARDNVVRMRACGCTVLYGTDVPNNVAPGIDVAELRLLVELGMTPGEVIDAATVVPAAYFGLQGIGVLEVGSRGILLAVKGDPYADVGALQDAELLGGPPAR